MSLSVQSETYLRSDIQAILRALDAASAAIASHVPTPEAALYRVAFNEALVAVGVAFHVSVEKAPLPANLRRGSQWDEVAFTGQRQDQTQPNR